MRSSSGTSQCLPVRKHQEKTRFLPVLLTLLHLLSSAGCSPLPCAFVLQHIRILGQTPSLKNMLYNISHFCLIFSSSAGDINGNFPLRGLPFDHARVSYKHYVKTGFPQLLKMCSNVPGKKKIKKKIPY